MNRSHARTALLATGLVTTAVLLGLGVAHVLELAPKRELSGPTYVTVQLDLYRYWGPVGSVVEPLALLCAVGLVVLARGRRAELVTAVVSTVCVAVMLVVFFTVIAPVNAEQAHWTAQAFPANWRHYRDRWEIGHVVHATLAAVAFGSLVVGSLSRRVADRPASAGAKRPRRHPRPETQEK